jgi:hypothetical protein
MSSFLDAILAYPTVFFTVPLGVTMLYWLFVILGAVGVDILDGDVDLSAGAKAASGALEGGAKAAGGMLDVDLEAGAKAAGGVAEGGHDSHADSSLSEVLGFAGIPITVSGSFVIFFSWSLSLLANTPLKVGLGELVPGVLLSGGLALLSLVLGTLIASLAVRPLRPIFVVKSAPGRESLMGRVCTINSGSVTERFGHATFEDGGAGFILNVFCARSNELKRGDPALILGYDPARDVYEVEPVDWLLPEETEQLRDPLRAQALARARSRVR